MHASISTVLAAKHVGHCIPHARFLLQNPDYRLWHYNIMRATEKVYLFFFLLPDSMGPTGQIQANTKPLRKVWGLSHLVPNNHMKHPSVVCYRSEQDLRQGFNKIFQICDPYVGVSLNHKFLLLLLALCFNWKLGCA